jgi:threonine dehydrogenase-like Zn-dependent dehydrogenase
VVDAVGMEAHGAPVGKAAQTAVGWLPDSLARPLTERYGIDRLTALHTAIRAVRRGGTVSLSGVYGGEVDPMPMMDLFDKGVQLRMGQAHVRRWTDQILPLLADDDVLGVEGFATHRLPLTEAPHGYEIFQKKEDDCVKVVLKP